MRKVQKSADGNGRGDATVRKITEFDGKLVRYEASVNVAVPGDAAQRSLCVDDASRVISKEFDAMVTMNLYADRQGGRMARYAIARSGRTVPLMITEREDSLVVSSTHCPDGGAGASRELALGRELVGAVAATLSLSALANEAALLRK